jgi:ABC-type phosphate/phosphonate transport system substrate-binding protein
MVGCRRLGSQGPTLQPTLTLTPRSTPLPALEPTLVPGAEDNPIQMAIVRAGGATTASALNRAADAVAEALLEETGFIVEVELVETDADAVAALCNALTGSPAVAWVSGVGYAAISAQACGVPALVVERGTARQLTTSQEVQIVVNDALGITTPAELGGRTFCRLAYNDLYSWLVPVILLRADGVSNLPDAIDSPDIEAMLASVAEGECDAAGITAADFEEFGGEVEDSVRVLNQTATMPYSIFVYPPSFTLDTRRRLIEGLLAMEASNDLETLLDQDGLARFEDADLDDFETFLQSTGLDFAQLGS